MSLTDNDRLMLRYHPTLQYMRKQVNSPEYTNNSRASKIEDYTETLSSDTFLDIYDILEHINRLLKKIEDKYMNGSKGNVGNITFTIYKSALGKLDITSQSITEAYENFQIDCHGKTDLEVYHMLVDLKEEWSANLSFFKSATLLQVEKNLSSNFTINSDEFKNYCNTEIASINALYEQYKQQDNFEANAFSGQAINYDHYAKLLDDIKTKEDRLNSKIESIESMNLKIASSKAVLNAIEHIISLIRDISIKDSIKDLLPLANNMGLNNVLLNYKLVLDKNIKKFNYLKTERETTANKMVKQQLNNDLIVATHVFNESTKPMARIISNMSDDQVEANPLLSTLWESINDSHDMYNMMLQSSYTMDANDKNILGQQLELIEKKHYVRLFYCAIEAIIKFMDNSIQNPNAVQIDNILDNILNQG
jgi:hypothetical protein